MTRDVITWFVECSMALHLLGDSFLSGFFSGGVKKRRRNGEKKKIRNILLFSADHWLNAKINRNRNENSRCSFCLLLKAANMVENMFDDVSDACKETRNSSLKRQMALTVFPFSLALVFLMLSLSLSLTLFCPPPQKNSYI
jgi:hypothetical protein